MPAVALRFRAELRQRWRAWLGLALIIALAGAVIMTLAAGARRTDSAYSRFLTAQRAYDVMVVNDAPDDPAAQGPRFSASQVRRIPGVVAVTHFRTFFAFIGAGVGVLVPPNERAGRDVNRSRLLSGRSLDPRNPGEVEVSFTFAEQYGIKVGDTIPFFDPSSLDQIPEGLSQDETDAGLAAGKRILKVLPHGNATVVGIEASPGEFPPQIEGTGRYLIHASPALSPVAHDLTFFNSGGDTLMVRLRQGERDVAPFLSRLGRLGHGASPNLVVQRELTANANRSVHIQALALWILVLLTAVASVIVVAQLVARMALLESVDDPVLSALGLSRDQRLVLGALRLMATALVAVVLALVVAAGCSGLFPTGLAATAETDPGFSPDWVVLAIGAAGMVTMVLVVGAWPTWRAARVDHQTHAPRRPSLVARVVTRFGVPVPVAIGARMALEPGRGRAAVPVRSSLVTVTLGAVTVVTALVFGASLDHLLASPSQYGQTWDAVLTSYDTTIDTVGLPAIRTDRRIDGIAVGNVDVRFQIRGQRVDGLAIDSVAGHLAPVILEGRTPHGATEIAMGSRTMRRLGLRLGQTIDVSAFATDRAPVGMRVVGRAVYPVFGEAGQLGDGVSTTLRGAARVSGESVMAQRKNVLVRLAPGRRLAPVVADLERKLGQPVAVIRQGRPTDIVNFGRVSTTPYLLGGVLGLLSIASLAHLLVTAVHRRRREFAIHRTLGW